MMRCLLPTAHLQRKKGLSAFKSGMKAPKTVAKVMRVCRTAVSAFRTSELR